eukprot:c15316_g1_i1.p1 GENE.c15316_g1_i1~~c15316_g1_i1.p1  ORF type:complete len:172 (+),score=32.99 c15316_g1_i1:435-950(+)
MKCDRELCLSLGLHCSSIPSPLFARFIVATSLYFCSTLQVLVLALKKLTPDCEGATTWLIFVYIVIVVIPRSSEYHNNTISFNTTTHLNTVLPFVSAHAQSHLLSKHKKTCSEPLARPTFSTLFEFCCFFLYCVALPEILHDLQKTQDKRKPEKKLDSDSPFGSPSHSHQD